MEKIRIVHDKVGRTLTVWVGDPMQEYVSEETTDEVVHMKDKNGRIIGVEVLNYEGADEGDQGLLLNPL